MKPTLSEKKLPIPPHIIIAVTVALAAMLLLLFNNMTAEKNTKQTSSLGAQSHAISMRFEMIGELSTQSAYITSVQVISNSRTVFGVTVPFTQNKYIYSYDCTVKAGIDFSAITYTVSPIMRTITVVLPPSYITSVSVDEDSLVVYNESQNIFSPLKLTNFQESRLEIHAAAEARAIETGILEEATANAKLLISTFLLSNVEYADYTIIWTTSEQEEQTP